MANCDNYILQLDSSCIRFEAVSRQNAVFFDESNRQLFVVKNGGLDGVQVKGPDLDAEFTFRLSEKCDIISIKFSPNFATLAIQRSQNVVQFLNFSNGIITSIYSQSSKGKNSKIIGFVWTSNTEIVFICESGIEHFQIIPEKQIVKHLKSFNISVNWFIFQPSSVILLLSTGVIGNVLQGFQFRVSSMYKLSKFEVEWTNKPSPPKLCLFERDVALVNLYGKTYLLVLRHETSKQSKGAQISLYTLVKEGYPHKDHVLELQLTGRFAMNVVDDLIVVHHQTSQTSLLFDIRFSGAKKEGTVLHHSPVVPPYSIKPFKIDDKISCELYSTNWVVFQPNIIIDAKLGFLWLLQLNLLPLCRMMSNDSQLFDFLLLRQNSKPVILNMCRNVIGKKMFDTSSNVLGKIAFLFNKLNAVYRDSLSDLNESKGNCFETGKKTCTVIDQTDMFSSTFSIFEESSIELHDEFIIAVLFEYINSLVSMQIPVQYFIYELLINVLIRSNRFYQLHQFLQYHVFTDSKPLACLLLSLQPKYSHAIQLALDMFKRLSVAQEDIVDIFLSQYEVVRALRYIQRHGNVDNVSARKFLEFAMNSRDNEIFYSVFKFFEERNMRIRGSPNFVPGEHCEVFVKHFENLFGPSNHVNEILLSN